jgi:hypothetical protein
MYGNVQEVYLFMNTGRIRNAALESIRRANQKDASLQRQATESVGYRVGDPHPTTDPRKWPLGSLGSQLSLHNSEGFSRGNQGSTLRSGETEFNDQRPASGLFADPE